MRLASRNLLQVALTALAATTLAHAADLVKPNIKPGLWEVSTTPQVSGQMPIPDEQLAKMTPEQRAKMEAAMKSYMANSAKPRVYKDCMTPEKIAKGFDVDRQGEDSSCKRKVLSSSTSELTLHDECNRSAEQTVSDVHFEIKGGTQMSGKINVVNTSSSGKTFTFKAAIQGKWLSASCGSVKDIEKEK
jgi:hypothetical protein